MRKFRPNNLGLKKEWFAEVIEKRLQHSGEYVYHLPSGKDKQAVVMNYQYMPSDSGLSQDYILIGTNPALYGLIDHFETKPELYRAGDSVREPTGSQFEIRGLIYNVKRVDVNHRGYITIELVQDDNCATPRPEFDQEMGEFLCSNECNCEDTC